LIGWYFLLMAVNTVLTFARGLALAGFLSVEDFGLYVTFMAIGMFASVLLGIGEIEATIKSFPRAIADGNPQFVLDTSRRLNVKLAWRTAVVVVVLTPVFYFATSNLPLTLLFALAIVVALPTATLGVYASVARAVPDLILQARSSLLRTVLALILCCTGAYLIGTAGALAGEIIAALIAHLYAQTILHHLKTPDAPQQASAPAVVTGRRGGLWLLAASLLASGLLYLDRTFVAFTLGVEEAGRFGLLMIFVSGANALLGQAAQKIGPDIVKAQHGGATVRHQFRIMWPWLVAFAGVILVMISAGLAAAQVPVIEGFLQRFRIGPTEMLLAAGVALLQIFSLFDWILISFNREKLVFASVLTYASALVLAALTALYWGLSLQVMLSIMIGARCVQILAQWVLILRYEGGETHTRSGRP
jgi:O-antigen/teichoic acid export membrane protein